MSVPPRPGWLPGEPERFPGVPPERFPGVPPAPERYPGVPAPYPGVPPAPGPYPGVPPVPGPLPPARAYDDPLRVDLEEQLLRRRIVRVSGRLDVPAAETAVARVLLADADGPDPIQLHLNCPDGELAAAVVLAETLGLVRARVSALAGGSIGGPVVAGYAAARHRRAHQHTRFVLSEPRATFAGRGGQLAAEVAVQADQLRFLQLTIATATGRDADEVAADMRATRILTALEAVDYGLVHELV